MEQENESNEEVGEMALHRRTRRCTMAEPESTGQRPEREFEIGRDEGWSAKVFQSFLQWSANAKRTYDEYQQESLETIRRSRDRDGKVLSDAQQFDNARQVMANQALQNAIESANMISKQAVRHGDLAIDRQWNIDEVAQLTSKTAVELDAVMATLVEKLREKVAGI